MQDQQHTENMTSPESMASHNPVSSEPGKKKISAAYLIGIAIICVFVISFFVYTAFFRQSPEKVMASMYQSLENVQSFSYIARINMETAGSFMTDQVEFDIDVIGQTDVSDKEMIKGHMDVSMHVASGMDTIEMSLQSVSLGNDIYVTLTKAPQILFFDLSAYENQWWRLDMKEMEENPYMGVKTKGPLMDIRALDILKKYNVITITKAMSDQENGIDLFRYEYTVNKQGLKNALVELDMQTQENQNRELLTVRYDQVMQSINIQPGEIWIRKDNHLPYKWIGKAFLTTSDAVIAINMQMIMDEYNQPVNISAPMQYESLNDLIEGYFGAMMPYADMGN